MPVPSGWTDELLSVHMIEHVLPPLLRDTIREWSRVLRVGGTLRIHTPNGDALGRALVDSASGERDHFWAVQSAIYGYGPGPEEATGPERLGGRGDHKMLFTFSVLRRMLEDAGFWQVKDVSGEDPCYHSLAWEAYVPGLCLEVQALKGRASSEHLQDGH